MLKMWTCQCGNVSTDKMPKCRRCGSPQPTDFKMDVDGEEVIVSKKKPKKAKSEHRKAGYDLADKQIKSDISKKTRRNLKNLQEAPEGQIFQSAMRGNKR